MHPDHAPGASLNQRCVRINLFPSDAVDLCFRLRLQALRLPLIEHVHGHAPEGDVLSPSLRQGNWRALATDLEVRIIKNFHERLNGDGSFQLVLG